MFLAVAAVRTQITATPEAILALAIFADAPLEDVIVVGCGLIPVASSKKSIVVKTTWPFSSVQSESVPSNII